MMLSHLFGGKLRLRGNMNCIDGMTPKNKSGREHGEVVEGNTVGKFLGVCRNEQVGVQSGWFENLGLGNGPHTVAASKSIDN